MQKGKCTGTKVGFALLVIGGLNWGLVGLGGWFGGNWNVVNLILGGVSWLENLVYVLVGLAAVMSLFKCKCKVCKSGDMESK
ncbi:MAG TPA: DUF378 domain-containing protein [Candidatus Magasanikbacteria bacterium]|nr:MAG: hypothetical protein A3I74_00240 [Candidatus Magasanikbacteria bacterium RIFCSPLOWO2_02_FULL_47_16]OGH80117.1 MAG: hypothetical protein A3C10_02990 [Candidatus Magasanikbacteria bacterium RIFCSPHIGHO2_02_FULL_48_18]OGH83196.1 MAG: hypothetical protein A3G08_02705 [Candidatus Magasanikbacteria bacterium RIFCSPLOWO2_12_FULL_47_9b]HAZ28947.1 DUF378 domain-containing protein [Candidatus Magasanikbacteria bacterium]